MKSRAEVESRAEAFYRNNHRAWLAGEFSPLSIGLQPPTGRDVATDGGRSVGAWLTQWKEHSGVVTVRKRIGHLGTYEVPTKLVLDTPEAAAKAAGHLEEWVRMAAVLDQLVDALGDRVRAPLATQPQTWAQWGERVIAEYIAVIRWLREHDSRGYYIRELPIRGVDTKWIETHRSAVELVHPLQGFRSKPALVEVRTLDPRQPVGGFQYVQCSVDELAAHQPGVENIIMVENHHTFLALPSLNRTWAIFGGGYYSDALAAGMSWLVDKNVYYWGDLDSHGFNMVSRTRAVLPGMRTILMDLGTVLRHEELAVEEPTALPDDPGNLTPGERQALEHLRVHARGRCLRIEQERIDFRWVCGELAAAVDGARAAG